MTVLDVLQSQDSQLHAGDTVVWQDEPYVVRSVAPRARCSWLAGRLNADGQVELHPVEVVVELARFDGMPA